MQRVWRCLGSLRFCRNSLLLPMQIYEGEVEPWLMSDFCTEDVPVLMRRRNFCSSFAADARDFRTYNSWVLSLMLNQVPPVPDRESFTQLSQP